jgi:Flp pilus assembly protein TadD
VLELDGSYLPARVNLAFLLQAEGRFKQAWDELSCVLKEDSGFAPALEARGIISLQMGNTFGALLDINNAIKVSIQYNYYYDMVHYF